MLAWWWWGWGLTRWLSPPNNYCLLALIDGLQGVLDTTLCFSLLMMLSSAQAIVSRLQFVLAGNCASLQVYRNSLSILYRKIWSVQCYTHCESSSFLTPLVLCLCLSGVAWETPWRELYSGRAVGEWGGLVRARCSTRVPWLRRLDVARFAWRWSNRQATNGFTCCLEEK